MACDPPGSSPLDARAPAPAVVVASPAPAADAAAPLPALVTACDRDEDCALDDIVIAGPQTCCSGCTWNAATKASLVRLRAACEAARPEGCVVLGCTMAILEPRCVAKRCVALPKKP